LTAFLRGEAGNPVNGRLFRGGVAAAAELVAVDVLFFITMN
jgi:hypothetical protein